MNTAPGNGGNLRYHEVYQRSINDPEGFWEEVAGEVHWHRKWDKVLDNSNPPFTRWFTGGETNLCYNALDRHVLAGSAEKAALIWDSPGQDRCETITYGDLYRRVNRFAAVLRHFGVQKGDRVAIYLPVIPEAVVAMLACVRIGAIHVVIFTGFGVGSLAKRLTGSQPKVLITADGALRRSNVIPLKDTVDLVLNESSVEKVIVLDRGLTRVNMVPDRDYYWADLVNSKWDSYVEPLLMESNEPSYVLYTSSTSGETIGVVRDTGAYTVALYNVMKQVCDVRPGDVCWAAVDIGWVFGHTFAVYAPLVYGVTSVMFEGTPDYPDHGIMWRIIEKHQVNIMFSAPTTMRMLHRFGIEHVRRCDISSLRYLFLAGEILDAPTWQWCTEALEGRSVIDHYWLTESGWPMVGNQPGIELLPTKPGYAGKPIVGYDMIVVDNAGKPVPAGTPGYIVARPPLPPGNTSVFWGDGGRYRKEYWEQFPGMFVTGDWAVMDSEGYIKLLGRTDEVFNVAAHRLSMREIESVILQHTAVAEVCVIGVADIMKGEEPVAFVVLEAAYEPSSHLRVEIKNLVRDSIGAVATPRNISFVPTLPRTRSGTYMKRVLKAVCEKNVPADLNITENGVSPKEVQEAIQNVQKMLETTANQV